MNPKSLIVLEYHKILGKLKAYASFSASEALATRLRPTSSLPKALDLQAQTREARYLLSLSESLAFSGVTDLAPLVNLAQNAIVLEAPDLIAMRNTLISARDAKRNILNRAEELPHLADIAEGLTDGSGLIDLINRTINERGEVLDSASPTLGQIRGKLKVVHARLMDRLMRYINDANTMKLLQEALITQRGGRYVLPLRAECKGSFKSIVHDQSASGATLFVEPLAVVELNNEYRELELAERDEVLRVLRGLTLRVAELHDSLVESNRAMAELDLILMKAKYADELDAVEPELLAFDPKPAAHHPGSVVCLRRARHPLLDPEKVVPIDVEMDPENFAIVLTGPNTGGKTVTLKTVGLAVLMAQSGMPIAAQSGSSLSVFRDVFADIGDEQSIEQSLSTFSGHITQLVRILKRADYRSMILLDELGSGTDPQEGSALARAVLTYLLERRITSIVATHYPELKAYAHVTKGAVNASLEFDLETLRPTYRLTIGLPGRSNALAIAERLGLKPEIIEMAKQDIDPTELGADDLLEEIRRQRDLASESYAQAERARKDAENTRKQLNQRLDDIENRKDAILEATQNKAEEELEDMRRELREVRKTLARLQAKPEQRQEMAQVVEKIEQVEVKQEKKARQIKRRPRPKSEKGPLKVGEKVIVRKLGTEAVISAIDGETFEVQAGVLRLRVRAEDLRRKVAEEVEEPVVEALKPEKKGRTRLPSVASPGLELDLRGKRVEDGLDELKDWLEKGFAAGMLFGRVVHGHGTGAMKDATRDELRHSPFVKRWEVGGEKEGGDGVSVVFFDHD